MLATDIQHQLQPTLQRLTQKVAKLRSMSPLPAAFASSLEHKLMIELTHGSTAIEGNTLTLRETQLLIDEGITPQSSKQLRELHETINHHRAVLRMQEFIAANQPASEVGVCYLHRLIMANIDDERSGSYRDERSGSYRSERVFVTGAPKQPIRAELVPEEMRDLFTWTSTSDLHPLILAGEAHYRFVKIHPFYDGNGRTARLLFNWLLLSHHYPLTVIPAEARTRYITSLDQTDHGNPRGYFELLSECAEASLDQYLAL